ncbi:NADH dehydrogenase [ubiquinone] flavoprotein 3, mitochondrial isoform X2 [Perognathus longimembris pacificus]|uniref:NADH dehydrogenase [ubiquinone] flavoprotein 3, mitochondrial isoform X2 n=1 Tax=Perognathus longimembris pacificus TaxID=214514 RepID=UPI0020184638|nr:NADH dehydrogenase [ubiquinone] flavoprotein 3, mitochondrial isoform X2 [Perognathus longimembris pacificus]
MAAWLLLRRGPPRVLKTMLLEAQVFRGLTSTASLSESVKNGTGLPSSSKKQSPSKNPGQAEPAQAPAPPEPFDNTTYRNLQHHDYNAYTFLDVNLDLSRFRLPQPSSGRESPRH